MKQLTYAMILALATLFVGCDKTGTGGDGSTLSNNKDSVSYVIGYDIGKNFASQGIEVNVAVFCKALE
ncbi:MAG: Domain amino terminal to FKBP-type peptidyl-prolyl isomerase, partial [Bacteroidota bacterium]